MGASGIGVVGAGAKGLALAVLLTSRAWWRLSIGAGQDVDDLAAAAYPTPYGDSASVTSVRKRKPC
ncbi:MAG: hypothetical protein OXF67_05695 [Cyanobacteria bacterium MAG CAR4_bin_6]|nr:hypothetical protein [Cyanobacteria bacterium MAG CAR4_bin_6]MCY4234884.1 hypothetical protein [Cyanobacteria bacterium MAG CAR2_bin_4]